MLNEDVVVAGLAPVTPAVPTEVEVLQKKLAAKSRDLRIVRILNAMVMFMACATGFVLWDLLHTVKQKEYVGSIKQIEDDARADLKKRPTYPGEDAYLQMRVAYALLKQGKTDEAYAAYEAAKKLDTQKTSECQDTIEFATSAYRKGDYAETKRLFDEIISFAPRTPQPYCTYAMLLATSGEDDFRDGNKSVLLAEQGLVRSDEKQKRSAWLVLAVAAAEAGDFERAVQAQTEAIATPGGLSGGDERIDQQKMAYRLRLFQAHVPVRWWPRNIFSVD